MCMSAMFGVRHSSIVSCYVARTCINTFNIVRHDHMQRLRYSILSETSLPMSRSSCHPVSARAFLSSSRVLGNQLCNLFKSSVHKLPRGVGNATVYIVQMLNLQIIRTSTSNYYLLLQ